MKNASIGKPNETIKSYLDSSKRRSIKDMTQEECKMILELATDNGEWKCPAVENLDITSKASNFVEGAFTFCSMKKTWYFSIRYDGTIEIQRAEWNEEKKRYKYISKEKMSVYNFANIILYMMKRGLDVTSHLD